MIHSDESVGALLLSTLQRFIAEDAQIVQISAVPLDGGMSGAAVWRHTIEYTAAGVSQTTSLITKDASRHEWRVLQHLQAQRQPNIPFAHALDHTAGERLLICLQDVGSQNRPSSLDPITDAELIGEAEGLASIHAANLGTQAELAWLPQMSAETIQEMLFVRAWLPAWESALTDTRFVETFRAAIPHVEAAAATIVEDMRPLLEDEAAQTLIHADLNPSNVLVQQGQHYIIDWETALWGPFYIDLPHHHCTLGQAEHYRVALAARGYVIDRQDFAERYRVAARYIGLRYIWWTLEYWREDPTQTPWVEHYIRLITGDGI